MALNARYNVFASDLLKGATFQGKYEFPQIAPIHISSIEAIPFDRIKRSLEQKSPFWVHFYVFDKRFQPVLVKPDVYAAYLRNYAGIIGIDNSLYRDLPLAEQIQSVYTDFHVIKSP
ncbi:MAG: DUF4417 domain-containing protein [Victivallales bacterium]|nr:DUF4417 domain-containing protein [Victivallales bacterium]